MKKFAGQ